MLLVKFSPVIVGIPSVADDTCVSLQEYETAHQRMPVEVARTMFRHFDADMDQCLNVADMQTEFHLIDHNGTYI